MSFQRLEFYLLDEGADGSVGVSWFVIWLLIDLFLRTSCSNSSIHLVSGMCFAHSGGSIAPNVTLDMTDFIYKKIFDLQLGHD